MRWAFANAAAEAVSSAPVSKACAAYQYNIRAGSTLDRHIGDEVFDRLKMADGDTELNARARVCDGGFQTVSSTAGGIGGHQDQRRVAHAAQSARVGRDPLIGRAFELNPGDPSRPVERIEVSHGDCGILHIDDCEAASDSDEQHIG